MTDAEIIKALECCMNGNCDDNCPFRETKEHCYNLDSLILDLINRQRAEIGRLKDTILTIEECLETMGFDETAIYCMQNDPEMTACFKANIKAEAIKEYKQLLLKKIFPYDGVDKKSYSINAYAVYKAITDVSNGLVGKN